MVEPIKSRNVIDPVDPSNGRRPSDVEWFQVERVEIVNGRTVLNQPLSPRFATIQKAEKALEKIKAAYPDAGIGGGVKLFNPLRESSVIERARFVRSLQ